MTVGARIMLRRFLAGLFLALFSFSAFAVPPVPPGFSGGGCGGIGPYPAPFAWRSPPTESAYQLTYAGGAQCSDGSIQHQYTAYECINGGVDDGTKCVAPPPTACVPGSTMTRTFSVGWTASLADLGSPSATPPVTYCDGSCTSGLDEVVSCYGSNEPNSSGWYELTCDVRYVRTGQTCAVQTPDPDNPVPSGPPGTGNGGDGGTGDGGDGSPSCADGDPDCDSGDGGTGGDGDGSGSGSGDGDGSGSGDGDGSGDGGTSPGGTTGGGGDSVGGGGTGSGSGTGGSGSGTGGTGGTDGTDEQGAECGVPGKPACSVKVDEAGTPSSLPVNQSTVDAVFQQQEAQATQHTETVRGDGDKGFLESFRSLFFVPNAAGCQPFNLPSITGVTGLQIDPCPVVDGLRLVASLMWYGTAFFLCLGMIKRVF